MKSLISIIILVIGLVNFSFSQDIEKISNSKRENMLKMEIKDLDGNIYYGIFISSDDSNTIFYNEKEKVFYSISNKEINRLQLYKRRSYGKAFGENVIFTSVGITILSMPIFNGDAMMIPPMFIGGFIFTIVGLPASAVGAITTKKIKIIDIDFIIDKENSLNDVAPIFHRNMKPKLINKDTKIVEIKRKNIEVPNLKNEKKPLYRKNPKYVNKVHFYAGSGLAFNNIKYKLEDNFEKSDFNDKIYTSAYLVPNYSLELSININDNIRIYGTYGSLNGLTQVGGSNEKSDHAYVNDYYSTASLGGEYVFSPIRKVLQKRYEISTRIGFVNTFHEYELWSESAYNKDTRTSNKRAFKDKFNIPGIEIGTAISYYVTKNISLKASLNASATMQYNFPGIKNTSISGDEISLDDSMFNIISLTPVFSFGFNF